MGQSLATKANALNLDNIAFCDRVNLVELIDEIDICTTRGSTENTLKTIKRSFSRSIRQKLLSALFSMQTGSALRGKRVKDTLGVLWRARKRQFVCKIPACDLPGYVTLMQLTNGLEKGKRKGKISQVSLFPAPNHFEPKLFVTVAN